MDMLLRLLLTCSRTIMLEQRIWGKGGGGGGGGEGGEAGGKMKDGEGERGFYVWSPARWVFYPLGILVLLTTKEGGEYKEMGELRVGF